ncbi:HYC_CC_PP family protein [Tenacibaculum finnmarkense]|uniref:HYC_CC_PP family protein n=1 Tax=Tenacibaculum finnmarkense TaxID=2781243 RepID=UPI001E419B09|nr:hypothetical protein [Tenacibaculum finnmarkense]MCD8401746.1 hypothetical protein [Tenacibaculum finnmarkense genomovar finnmarkense]
MNQLFTKIATIILALLVLISTFSFTVEKHYCGDFLVDISYLGEADNCGTLVTKNTCETLVKKKKCCKDEVYQIDGQDDLQKVSSTKISFETVTLFVAFHASYQLLFQEIETQLATHQYYLPPDLITDIQVLHEVFII